MNRFLTLGAVALIMVSAVWGGISPCPTGTATTSNYLNPDFSCTVDDKTFSGFSFAFTSSSGITINVTPDTTPLDPGLDFQLSGFTVSSGSSNDLKLGFTVMDNSGPNIEDASLNIGNGVSAIGTGIVSIGEGVCVGGTFTGPGGSCTTGNSPPNLLTLNVVNPNPPGSNFDIKFFGPVQTVGVSKDVSITAGSSGVAALSDLRENFSEVPEPAGISFVLGAGLLGLGLLRNKFKKA